MPSLYDIPTADILHGIIFPMLDYDSRIHLNRVLPPEERKTVKLPKHACFSHDIHVQIKRIKSHITRTNKLAKSQGIVLFLKGMISGRYIPIIKQFPLTYDAVYTKLTDLVRPHSDTIVAASPHFKKKIRLLSIQALERLNTTTFQRNVHITKPRKLSLSLSLT